LIPISKSMKRAAPILVLPMAFLGCAKKPKPAVEDPTVREETRAIPSRSTPDVSEEELRRQRIMEAARAAFQTIYFPLDQSVLDARARSVLGGIHRFMAEHPEVSFTVAGHCDERGTEEYNLALGELRAKAVTRYLADLGVSQARMKTLSYGEERPASEGSSESSWALNRRAEFTPEFQFQVSGIQP